jgi:CTP:molybdopterin cytidylyltransferase MocA
VLIVGREQLVRTLEPRVDDGRVELLVSRKAEALGPAGSLAVAALRLTQLDADGALLVTPVDAAPVTAPTMAALRARLKQPERLAARPRHGERGGHPVLLRPEVLDPYRRTSPPPLRDVLRGLGDRVADVAVDDDRILVDVDTPEDFARWCRRVGAPVSAPRFVRARSAPRD